MTVATAAVALGSNLGDRRALIQAAVADLEAHPEIDVVAVSTLIETEPVGPPPQGPYLNGAVLLRTTLGPRDLLAALHVIEAAHGRRRAAGQHWTARRLDLDLLLYDDLVLDEPGLTLPHPRMHSRTFVLGPLAEIAPALVHPVLDQTIRALYDRLPGVRPSEYDGVDGCSIVRAGDRLQSKEFRE